MIRTPLFETLGMVTELNAKQFFNEHNDDYLVGRVGEVSDTNAAIAYLASESFINGISLPVDGGLLCGKTRSNYNH